MSLLFPTYQVELIKSLNDLPKIDVKKYAWFLKGDISGIQDFIFSVKSRRASRTLKGRSFFIQALSELGIALVKEHLPDPENSIFPFYNGGGNFYLLLTDKFGTELETAREAINKDCADLEIYLNLSLAPIADLENDFSGAWKNINEQSGRDKLLKFKQFEAGFEPHPRNTIIEPFSEQAGKGYTDPFEALVRELIQAKNWDVISDPEQNRVGVGYKGIQFFGHKYQLKGLRDFTDIVHQLPTWPSEKDRNEIQKKALDRVRERNKGKINPENPQENIWSEPGAGDIIDFESLAAFAKERTGSEKLGILKMDVDNLGLLFQGIKGIDSARKVSLGIKRFFGEFLKALLNESFEYESPSSKTREKAHFCDNIYVVFAGGDDCFFLGGWDAVFEFAHQLHLEFTAFSNMLKQEVPELGNKALTLSAALIMVGPKFPVNRFAVLAEADLKAAKARKGKNAISVFGKILAWDAFAHSRKIARRLAELIYQEGERRAILERLQRESVEFEMLKKQAGNGIIKGRSSWRLLYTLRRTAQEKNLEELVKIAKEYADALTTSLIDGKAAQTPDLYKVPVAARWAEFLTRLTVTKSTSYEQSES